MTPEKIEAARIRRYVANDAREYANVAETLAKLESLAAHWRALSKEMLKKEHGGEYLLPITIPPSLGVCLTYWRTREYLLRVINS